MSTTHMTKMKSLHDGFSAADVIGTVYRVVKNFDAESMPEFVKLEMIREVWLHAHEDRRRA